MKGSILQLLIFLLLFISLAAVFFISGYLLWSNAGYSPDYPETGRFFQVMPGFLLGILPLVILMSVLFSYFVTVRMQINRILSFLFIFIVSSAVYFGSFSGLIRISSSDGGVSPPVPVIYEKRINPFKEAYVYAETIDSSGAYDVVMDKGELRYYKYLSRKDLDSELLEKNGNSWIARLNANPYFAGIFYLPPFIADFSKDVSLFNRKLVGLYHTSVYFFIFQIISEILFAVSLWSFLGISRWPLMNVFISLILVRGVFAVYPLWDSSIISTELSMLPDNIFTENSFSIALIAVSLIIFLVNGVISGLKRSRKDMSRG